jgi:hypothetical protein
MKGKKMKDKKERKEKFNLKLEDFEEKDLIEIVSLEDLLEDELKSFSAEIEIIKALYDDDF